MSFLICSCCLLVVSVREKQTMMSRAITTRKMKFDKVSKPSHLANVSNGPGIIAIIRKTIGSNSQATELLIEREFRFRQMIIIKNKIIVAIVISI